MVTPICRLASGADSVRYLSTSTVRSCARGTVRVTIWLFTVAWTTSLVALLTVRSMSVTSRPWCAAPVTILPSISQLTAQLVWPVTTTSIASSIRSTIGGSAPVRVPHWLIVVSFSGLEVVPPW